jgi:phosphoenolpyruvate synthase/pyruvate phosphate dikinase
MIMSCEVGLIEEVAEQLSDLKKARDIFKQELKKFGGTFDEEFAATSDKRGTLRVTVYLTFSASKLHEYLVRQDSQARDKT